MNNQHSHNDALAITGLTAALKGQKERLLPCVHCGFCLPACPTYVRLGDENDSPRGRLYLMKAVVEGRMSPKSEAFQTHIDRCLGCRACEPVCPSGVEYGLLLESAREVASKAGASATFSRLLMGLVTRRPWSHLFMAVARILRWTTLPKLIARIIPRLQILHPVRFGLAMLAATSETDLKNSTPKSSKNEEEKSDTIKIQPKGRVALLEGCVQSGLFSRVNRATERLLRINGYEVVTVTEQGCCGALHAHGGATDSARRLAIANLKAFDPNHFDFIATNSAGCGLALKEYSHLLEQDSKYSKIACAFSDKVRDISELLTMSDGPQVGGAIPLRVTYDAACHLCHGQGLFREPKALLKAIPNLEIVDLPGEEECCGGAGIYGITHGDLGVSIGEDKVSTIMETGADLVTTANPGCIMQIGAGLILAGASVKVQHPIELLDESYRRAGYYAE
ncbi:MAG: heterodisulfide reductase-related iron-sulfur binding cluster [bacterium]